MQPTNDFANVGHALRVEPGRRLIQQQVTRAFEQGDRQLGLALLSGGNIWRRVDPTGLPLCGQRPAPRPGWFARKRRTGRGVRAGWKARQDAIPARQSSAGRSDGRYPRGQTRPHRRCGHGRSRALQAGDHSHQSGFPEPFNPRKPNTSPSLTFRLTSVTARNRPNFS